MSSKLQFELTSPDKLALAKPVAMVGVPGPSGMYGVMPGHAPMVTTVAPGVVEIYGDNDHTVTERIFVTGGYCEVTTEGCSILADDILSLSALDKKAATAELTALTKKYDEATTGEDRDRVQVEIDIARAKIQYAA